MIELRHNKINLNEQINEAKTTLATFLKLTNTNKILRNRKIKCAVVTNVT